MNLPNALKRFRSDYNLLQREVADAAGINIRLYQKYESGETDPSASTIIRIAKHFNVSANFLLGITDIDAPDEIDEDNKYYDFDLEECKLLSVHKALDEGGRRALMEMADFLCNKQGIYPLENVAYPTNLRKITSLKSS